MYRCVALAAPPAVNFIDAAPQLATGRSAASAGWLERFRDQHSSLTDAVSFELMRQERLETAFAFDTDFVTAGFELLG